MAVMWLKFFLIFLKRENKKNINFYLFHKIEVNPKYTHKQLSKEMGVSLGKVNYYMKNLVEKGLIKLSNFSNNSNNLNYIYIHTSKGII